MLNNQMQRNKIIVILIILKNMLKIRNFFFVSVLFVLHPSMNEIDYITTSKNPLCKKN